MNSISATTAPIPERIDVAVVGGGVVGIACALELAREGAHVLVLERDRAGFGCSFGNAGWMTPSLALPLANPSVVFKSLGWLLDPESPLYIQPRLDPAFLRWLAGFMLAARRSRFERGAAALLQLCNAPPTPRAAASSSVSTGVTPNRTTSSTFHCRAASPSSSIAGA